MADICLFKGGTSLSKVFNTIQRFSEDIDLGITPASLGWTEADLDDAPTRSQRRNRTDQLEAACAASIQTFWQPRLEEAIRGILDAPERDGTWLRYEFEIATGSPVLHFSYPGALPSAVAYIAREVKVEFGSLTDQRPLGRHAITAMVNELAPTQFCDRTATVMALELERTFWEKATILHAEFHRPVGNQFRDRYARHYADLATLWLHELGRPARTRFDILDRVRLHKSRFFNSGWANYEAARPGTFRLVPPDHRIAPLRSDYEAMRQMFLNDPVPFDSVMAPLQDAERELNGS